MVYDGELIPNQEARVSSYLGERSLSPLTLAEAHSCTIDKNIRRFNI